MKISEQAHEALTRGIEECDNICDMELLGLNQRIINMLEEAGIQTLEELLNKRDFELLEIKNFGEVALAQIFDCLANYDKLADLLKNQYID